MLRALLLLLAFSLSHAASCMAGEGLRTQQLVLANDYLQAAQRVLAQELAAHEGRFEFEPRGTYRDLVVQAEDRAALQARMASTSVSPNMVVWVEVSSGTQLVRRLPVSFQVRWFKAALVAKHRIQAKTALGPDLFALQEVDVAKFGGRCVDSIAHLAGKRLKRELDADAVLGQNQMEDRPPVETGARIEVAARVGRVIVQRTAIAERDGWRGQRIGARVVDTDERLNVEVVGDNKAEVIGDG
jgi:flagella basal body P-ring formation protein FlgA